MCVCTCVCLGSRPGEDMVHLKGRVKASRYKEALRSASWSRELCDPTGLRGTPWSGLVHGDTTPSRPCYWRSAEKLPWVLGVVRRELCHSSYGRSSQQAIRIRATWLHCSVGLNIDQALRDTSQGSQAVGSRAARGTGQHLRVLRVPECL